MFAYCVLYCTIAEASTGTGHRNILINLSLSSRGSTQQRAERARRSAVKCTSEMAISLPAVAAPQATSGGPLRTLSRAPWIARSTTVVTRV